MESPISRSYINDFTFAQMIKEAKVNKIKDINEKIGEFNNSCSEDILDKVLKNTSKLRVCTKFKALKDAANDL